MRKSTLRIAALVFACLAHAGCGENERIEAPDQGTISTGPTTLDRFREEEPPQEAADRPRILRSGSLELLVNSLDSAEFRITAIALRNSAYISRSERKRNPDEKMAGELELRIPSAQFEATLAAMKTLGTVMSEQTTSSDVSGTFIDLAARLATQRRLEERLLNLLTTRKGDLAEVIRIEEKLASVRATIEEVQGRLRYLDNRVDMSVLTVVLSEPGGGVEQPADTSVWGTELSASFDRGLEDLASVAGTLVRGLVFLLPFALPGWLTARAIRRRIARKKRRAGEISV